jgi:hypothetical protein
MQGNEHIRARRATWCSQERLDSLVIFNEANINRSIKIARLMMLQLTTFSWLIYSSSYSLLSPLEQGGVTWSASQIASSLPVVAIFFDLLDLFCDALRSRPTRRESGWGCDVHFTVVGVSIFGSLL